MHTVELFVKLHHFAYQTSGGRHRHRRAGRLDLRLVACGKFGNRTLQFVDAAFQATRATGAIRAHELRHLLEGLLHGLVQVQLSLGSLFLRRKVLQLRFARSRYLLVQRADLCFQYADAGGHVALQFGQIRLRAARVAATGRTRGRDQGRFGLRRLKGQFRHLGRHALGIELVHRVTGQAHGLNPRHGMPVPVNDCI